jgi:hypothetical protein
VALAYAPDRGIARHLAQGLDAMRDQQRFAPHARGCERCFGAGVTATYHNNIIFFSELHTYEPIRCKADAMIQQIMG